MTTNQREPIQAMFAAAAGREIYGGCELCDAYQTMHVQPDTDDQIWHFTVHHDPGCPVLKEKTGQRVVPRLDDADRPDDALRAARHAYNVEIHEALLDCLRAQYPAADPIKQQCLREWAAAIKQSATEWGTGDPAQRDGTETPAVQR